MPRHLHLVLLAGTLVATGPCALSQMRGAGFSGGGRSISGRGFSDEPARFHRGRGIYLGDPFYYSDYPDGPYYVESGPPQVVLMQPPAAESAPESRVQPLMIELQGDRYVRTGGLELTSDSRSVSSAHSSSVPVQTAGDSAQAKAQKDVSVASAVPTHLPTVLVYRDGHREDVSGYAIVSSVIYARGDYWQDGYWTKNIQLSSLNIPATLKANQENGVKFILPAGPNEVVTRP